MHQFYQSKLEHLLSLFRMYQTFSSYLSNNSHSFNFKCKQRCLLPIFGFCRVYTLRKSTGEVYAFDSDLVRNS